MTGLSRHQSSASMSSVHTRNPGSLAQSVGSGVGRSNSTISRAQTSMSFHQSTNTRQRANTRVRPQTAMSSRNQEEPPSPEKQNCMMPSLSVSDSVPGPTIRKVASMQSMGQQASTSRREVSISTMMGKLSLKDDRAYDSISSRSQVISTRENCLPAPAPISLRSSSERMGTVTLRRPRTDEAASSSVPKQDGPGNGTVPPPETPHAARDALRVLDDFEGTLLASTKKYTSPTKSSSKVRQFLTKDSNTRAFTAWDMDERLVEVEAQFKQMKEVMNTSLKDKTHMEEVIEMAKSRGT